MNTPANQMKPDLPVTPNQFLRLLALFKVYEELDREAGGLSADSPIHTAVQTMAEGLLPGYYNHCVVVPVKTESDPFLPILDDVRHKAIQRERILRLADYPTAQQPEVSDSATATTA
jgi:hypothetical protein